MATMAHRLVAAFLVLFATADAASSQAVAPFYRSNPLTIIVGTGTGGNFDLQARIVARHLGRFIPGAPTIVVQNLPGAGGVVAANKIYNTVPKDGSVIGLISGTAMLEPLFGGSSIQFDPRKFTWIGGGSVKLPGSCIVWHTSAIKNAKDLFDKDVVIGATSGNTNLVFSVALKNVLGARMKIVRGYNSVNEVNLAMERGEVEGTCGLAWSGIVASHPQWITGKLVRIVLLAYVTPDPSWPKDVPNALEFAGNDEDRQVLQLIFGATDIQRPFMAPPDIPPERAAALRLAYRDMTQDAAFVADVAKSGLDFRPLMSANIESTLATMYQATKPLIARAAAIISMSR